MQKPKLTYEVEMPNKDIRLRELIVYISDKCANQPTYSVTILNKILWAVDFLSFQNRGKPITGEKYQRLERGPAPLRMMPVRRQMEADNDIVIRKVDFHGREQHRPIALRDADLTIFSGDEIALVDEIIGGLCRMTSTEISEWSHMRAWRTRHDYELMPYESCFLSDEPVTMGDIGRTEELSRKYHWDAYTSSH